MGKRTLSNAQTRVSPRYARRLAHLENQVAALQRRMDLERSLRLHEIAKQTLPPWLSTSSDGSSRLRALADAADSFEQTLVSSAVSAMKINLAAPPPKPLRRGRLVRWLWHEADAAYLRGALLAAAIFSFIYWVLTYVD